MEMGKTEIKNRIKSKIPAPLLTKLQRMHVVMLDIIYMLRYMVQSLSGKFGIRFLVLSVGQACNYKCRDCANFCPSAPKEYRRYELDRILESINRILKNVAFINVFQIQGGEPFLYSDLGGGAGIPGKPEG